ncbi:MAG: gliding motility protein GldM [Bacteroidota bacterium]|nr:gliding motility protein GldM [Bacteroidota bacterium]
MSLPKEPRQKMINMMYLVLTALLALNVSAEILNAFKTVNNSITTSNKVVTDKNNITYSAFEKALNDQQTKANAEIWAPKAKQIQSISSAMYKTIDGMKSFLILESQPDFDKEGKLVKYNDANLDAATRVFDKDGKGKILYDSLAAYKQQMLAVLNPNAPDIARNPVLQKEVARAQADFEKQLPLDLSVPQSQTGAAASNDKTKDWVTNYFHMTPTIAAITILSKFQNDVKNSESQMVDYCYKQIGSVKVVYNQFEAFAGTNATYLMPGDELEIQAGIGAFSAAAKPDISINGVRQTLNADGVADYKTKVEGAGEHSVTVNIAYTKPDGTTATIPKIIKYTVGLPSGASIFLEKMNVVYIGVDNPMTISGGSVGAEKVHVNFASPGASLTKSSGDHYIARATTPGMSKIIVTANGKNFEFPIRVKNLPLPAGFIGSKKGGSISSAEFKAIGGLIARLEDSDFEAPFKVVSYNIGAEGGGISGYTQATNEGNRWSGNAAGIVSRITPGTHVFFDNIRVIGPDGKQREIAPMVFSLK